MHDARACPGHRWCVQPRAARVSKRSSSAGTAAAATIIARSCASVTLLVSSASKSPSSASTLFRLYGALVTPMFRLAVGRGVFNHPLRGHI